MNDELQGLIKAVALAHDELILAEEARGTAESLERKAKHMLAVAQRALDICTYKLIKEQRQRKTELEIMLEDV